MTNWWEYKSVLCNIPIFLYWDNPVQDWSSAAGRLYPCYPQQPADRTHVRRWRAEGRPRVRIGQRVQTGSDERGLKKLLLIWLMNLLTVFRAPWITGGRLRAPLGHQLSVISSASVSWLAEVIKAQSQRELSGRGRVWNQNALKTNERPGWTGRVYLSWIPSWIIKSGRRSKRCRPLPSVLLISISTIQSNYNSACEG